VFEGASRRVENPVKRRADNTVGSSPSATGKATKKAVQILPLVTSAVPATSGASENEY
jgi:hypothetical protein